jgi:hypothetical protein
VGGAGHTVGREKSPSKALEELSSWARMHYPGAVQTHFWSAQDYTPIDDLRYVGPILPNNESIFVATGFNKWGMTNGAAAALALSSRMQGGRMDWSSAFASWSPPRTVGPADGHSIQPRGRLQLDQGLDHPGHTHGPSQPQRGRGRRGERTPVASGSQMPGRRHRAPCFTGMPAPGGNRELEQRRQGVGMPAARLAVRAGWHAARRTGHP